MKKIFKSIAFLSIVFWGYSLATAQVPEMELTKTEADFLRANPVIKVANEMDWPPFDYTELGRPKGFSIDYIKLIAKKSGFKIQFINGYTWNELLERFKNKSIDVLPVFFHNKDRESFTLFTKPYYDVKLGVLTRGEGERVKKIADLTGKRVGIQESHGSIPMLKSMAPGINFLESAENETLIELLATRQLDAVIGNTLLLAYLVKRNQAITMHLEAFTDVSLENEINVSFHMGVHVDSPILHRILVKAQESVSPSEMARIEQKWLYNQNIASPNNTMVELTRDEKAFIREHPEIVLAGGASFEPFLMKDQDGKIKGHDAEIVELIAKKTGLEFRIELGVWNEIQERAKNRELDGLTTAFPTKQRALYYNTSDPYIHLTPLVIVKRGNPKGIYSLDDITGKRAALQKGNAFKEVLEETGKEFEAVYFDSIQDVISSVAYGEVDFTLFEESAFYVARQIGLESMIDAAFPVGKPQALHFQLRNDWPELVTIVNKGLKSITLRQKTEIRNRWFGINRIIADNSKLKLLLTSDEEKYIKQKGVIKFCIDPTWMPYEQINEIGIHEGMSADYLSLFSERIGVQTELYHTKSWSESLEAIKNRQCDIMPLANASSKRKSYLNFTTPYITIPYVIATKTDEFFIEDINQALDKKFAVVHDYLIAEQLHKKYPNIKILEVENNIEGLNKVRHGEVYGYIGATSTLAYALWHEKITDIKITGKLPWSFELGVATRKDEPLLNDIFQKAVNNLTQEEKKRIHDKWIAVNVHKIVDYALLWEILSIVAIILIILVESHRRISKSNQKLTVLNTELATALEEIKTLRGIIPICCSCKKIRNDEGFWSQVESYVSQHTYAQFSHSYCPDCLKKAYKDAGLKPPEN